MKFTFRNFLSNSLAKIGLKRLSFFVRISSVGLAIYGGDAIAQSSTSELKPSIMAEEMTLMEVRGVLTPAEMVEMIEKHLQDPFLTETERMELQRVLARIREENESN